MKEKNITEHSYRIFTCPMAKEEETGKYTFIAEFADYELATYFAAELRLQPELSKRDIIIKKVECGKYDAESGTIDRLIAVTGEYLILDGECIE